MALLTLIGAAVGYPLLLWLDPLALLSAAITSFTLPGNVAAWWLLSGLVAVLVLSLTWPNVWCAKICPLGGTQEAVFAVGKSLRNMVRDAAPGAAHEDSFADRWHSTPHGVGCHLRGRLGLGDVEGAPERCGAAAPARCGDRVAFRWALYPLWQLFAGLPHADHLARDGPARCGRLADAPSAIPK